MSSADSLLRATLNRLVVRLGHGLVDAAASLAVLAQDAPERLSREWDLFQQEVAAEADRLEQEFAQPGDANTSSTQASEQDQAQAQIDRLRAKVADLNRKVEVKH